MNNLDYLFPPKISKQLSRAFKFADYYHTGQLRKYTNMPYITHPLMVSAKISIHTDDINMLQAALLHDVVEDTCATLEQIKIEFGGEVALYVENLTDISKSTDGNRAVRKEIDRQHLSKATPKAKTIKLADLIDNTSSIVSYDKDFAKVYMHEKKLLLEVLKDASHPELWEEANSIVENYYEG